MQYLIVLAVLGATFWLITGPMRAAHRTLLPVEEGVAALEAARDAKLQEIREAELDLRTGKLSDEDYGAIDATLRTEAIEILRRLDAAHEREAAAEAAAAADPPLPSAS